MKQKLLVAALVLAAGMFSLVAIRTVSAQESSTFPNIVQKLATRFGLKQEDVMQVFEEERTEHQAQMKAHMEEALAQAVTDGKITEAQKQTLLQKHEEIRQKMDALKDLSLEEHKTKAKEIHEEFRTWLKDSGINLEFMKPFGKGFRHGFKMGYWFGNKP